MRCFIAVEPSTGVRDQLAGLLFRLRATGVPARWVAADNLHLTMKFLGDIEQETVAAVVEVMHRVSAGQSPFDLRLQDFGFFPPHGRPRILCIGVNQRQRLQQLAERLERDLTGLGFPPEGRFAAHITLARLKGTENLPQLKALLDQTRLHECFPVTELALFESLLGPAGAQYRLLAKATLRG